MQLIVKIKNQLFECMFERGSQFESSKKKEPTISRRGFLKGALATGAVLAMPDVSLGNEAKKEKKEDPFKNLLKLIGDLNEKYSSGEMGDIFGKNSEINPETRRAINGISDILEYLQGSELVFDEELTDSVLEVVDGFNAGNQGSFDNGLSRMSSFFARNEYFFNIAHATRDGNSELFISGKYRETSEMIGGSELKKMLPKEIVETEAKLIFISSDKYPNLGGMRYGTAAINLEEISEAYDSDFKNTLPSDSFWSEFSQNHLAICVINNEMTHHALRKEFDFFPETEHDWMEFSRKNKIDPLIENSNEVHEFLSDAFTVCTDSRFFIFKLRHIILGESGKSDAVNANSIEGYGFSTGFSIRLVRSILEKNDKKDLIIESGKYISRVVDEGKKRGMSKVDLNLQLRENINSKTKELASEISEKDLGGIRDEFARMANILIEEIRKISQKK